RKLYFSGTDPRTYFEEKVENSMTVAQCLDYWFDNYVSTTLREKTQALYRSTVMKRMHDAFPNRPASSITVKQWVDLLTEEEKDNPRRARQVLSQLRSAISWCMRRQLIDSCAIMSIQPRDFGSRAEVGDRVLSYHELAKIWLAIERSRASTSNKLLHQMLMLWGARLSELRLATKTEFDLLDNVWTVPKEHSKMGNVIRRPIFE
ncbi:integrase, partial [Shigella flexneri]|nr:integrase [Shigella flexneri]EGE4143714.1 integrase [Shigella flexneri]MLO21363.1 integrase [Shigella flexneri]